MCIYRNNRNLVTFSHHVQPTVNQLNKVVYLDIKSVSIKAFGFIRKGIVQCTARRMKHVRKYVYFVFSLTVKGKSLKIECFDAAYFFINKEVCT